MAVNNLPAGEISVPQPSTRQLQHMLADQQASYHMLLGTALPVDQELEDTLKDAGTLWSDAAALSVRIPMPWSI